MNFLILVRYIPIILGPILDIQYVCREEAHLIIDFIQPKKDLTKKKDYKTILEFWNFYFSKKKLGKSAPPKYYEKVSRLVNFQNGDRTVIFISKCSSWKSKIRM